MIDLNHLIAQASAMAPLPASTVRLFQLLERPDFDVTDVADLIAFDQALMLRLLRAANSAASGGATPVSTVHEAVLRMGAFPVITLAVACGARSMLQSSVPAYGLDEGALWQHSVAAAVAAELLPEFCLPPAPPETFTAALLHDAGKLVMGRFLSPEILGFIRRAQEVDHLGVRDAEALILGVHHAELGGLIAQHWKLPPRIVKGITYHHDPGDGDDVVCDYVYAANLLAKHIEAGLVNRALELEPDPATADRLGLTSTPLSTLVPPALDRYAEVSLRFNAV